MKNKKKIMILAAISIVLILMILLVCAVIVRKEISENVMAFHDEMMTNLETSNDFYVDEAEHNISNG